MSTPGEETESAVVKRSKSSSAASADGDWAHLVIGWQEVSAREGHMDFDHVLESIADLEAAFPDLGPIARDIQAADLPHGAEIGGYVVRTWSGGWGSFGAFEVAIVGVRAHVPGDDVRTAEYLRPVFRRGRVDSWGIMVEVAGAEGARPSFSNATAEQSLRAAIDHAAGPLRFVTELQTLEAVSGDANEVMQRIVWAIAEAYRAGRFMREAELAQQFELRALDGDAARAIRQAGAKAVNVKRRSDTVTRQSEVRRLAEEALKLPPPNGRRTWSRDALAEAVAFGWKLERAPAVRTIEKDLSKMQFPVAASPKDAK